MSRSPPLKASMVSQPVNNSNNKKQHSAVVYRMGGILIARRIKLHRIYAGFVDPSRAQGILSPTQMGKEAKMENEMLISVIRQQRDQLGEILSALETGALFEAPEYDYVSLIKQVEINLRKLRRWIF